MEKLMKLIEIIPGSFYIRSKLKAKHLEELRQEKLVVISLSPTADPVLASQYEHYFHCPMSDGKVTEKLLTTVLEVMMLIKGFFEADMRVVVHCNAGRNRSGLIAALVLKNKYGLTGKQALDKVRHLRPRAVANEHFEQYLLSL